MGRKNNRMAFGDCPDDLGDEYILEDDFIDDDDDDDDDE